MSYTRIYPSSYISTAKQPAQAWLQHGAESIIDMQLTLVAWYSIAQYSF